MKTITYILLAIIFVMLILISSCQTQKKWSKKGFNRGWVDTATVRIYDTVRLEGSTKDTTVTTTETGKPTE